MHDHELLAQRFEANRAHLRAVAYRMLGSLSEADDAVQESWLRLDRSDTSHVENLTGWLTTVVARVCLDMLRSRKSRNQEPLAARVPDPVVTLEEGADPEQHMLVADTVGLALLVVLDSLTPAERLAFVLHDMFAVPFSVVAAIVGGSPAAARQLASRARRLVQTAAVPDPDITRQRKVADAFLAASRDGDFDALLTMLDPHVTLRADVGGGPGDASRVISGAAAVANQALSFARRAQFAQPALVNGAAGVLVADQGQPIAVLGFTIVGEMIVEIHILADPARMNRLDLPGLGT
jgi:RNA polymerase sigma factor (sigma-70 family)